MADTGKPISSPVAAIAQQWTRLIPNSSRRAKVDARRLAIDTGPGWSRAILCERSAGRITIVRVFDEVVTPDGERANPREILGVPGAPCVIALAREESLIGRVELPCDDEAELRSMARMALVRDYSVEGMETLCDFQRSSTSSGVTSVVVAAATRARIDEASARAGSPVARISVRALGMLALIRASDTMQHGCTLAVDATRDMLECTLVREQACASCLPLAGLLLEDDAAVVATGDAIDLLHPTALIDVAARTRQRILTIAGIMVIAGLGGWTFGARSWSALEGRHDDLRAKARTASPLRLRYKRDDLKVKHIEAYRLLAPDWLAHFDGLRRFAPDPSSVVLDSLSAQLDATEIEYSDVGKMSAKPELRFILDGEAKDRTTADALRDALVKEKGYTVGSTGADARGGRRLPYPFAYTLRTTELEPKQLGVAGGAADPAAKAGGGS